MTMRRLRTIAALLGIGMAMSACASVGPARSQAQNDAGLIRSTRAAQNQAIAAGFYDSAATIWTEDVTIRRGLGTPIAGREAYRRLIAEGGVSDSSIVYQRDPTSVDISPRWPLAFETGNWAGHVGRADGPVVITGRYSAQWVKRGNRWLIRSEVFVALNCAGTGCASTALP